ncbi:hypothetical protein [Streptomyces sp. UNOC14_S4]|uniref:hypothetical protein n=1 Tax=Streptomyces sp. UNOC14_S4 TaxID=2872340 RepID=UPI001E377EA6|nr:hypothetical protein [Streptomyces sp. UNOC14_S4]MCC3769745.1 hypothetical protein [Streptomyces sp. UNOC14_S4]
MRKAAWTAAASLIGVMTIAGCGGDSGSSDGKKSEAKASAAGSVGSADPAGSGKKPGRPTPAKGTLVERAAGSWKSIGTPGPDTLDTLTVTDGKAIAKGAKLSCTGTFTPAEKDGKESATITLTCEGGKDGGRGLGHLQVKPDGSALFIDFDGPEGGWGGPVDSYRRA